MQKGKSVASQERLEYFISAAFKDEGVRQAMQAFGKLNAESAKVVREMERLSAANAKVGNSIRDTRTSFSQLGMQVNQFGTQLAGGTSIATAFAQQIGDVGWALSNAGGALGRVGAFLAGPWGAGLALAAAALGPFIDGLFKSGEAADSASKQYDKANGSVKDLIESLSMYGEMSAEVARQRIWTDLQDAERRLAAVQSSTGAKLFPAWATGLAENQKNVQRLKWQLVEVEAEVAKSKDRMDQLAKSTRSVENARASGGTAKYTRDTKALNEELSTLQLRFKDLEKMQGGPANIAMREMMDNVQPVQPIQIDVPNILGDVKMVTEEMQQAFTNIGNSVSEAFKGMLTAGMSWKEGMKGIIQSVIDELWRMYVVQQIVGFITSALGGLSGTSGAGMDKITTSASSFNQAAASAMPKFANGTNNAPGGMAIVGERGPELVNLPRGAQVIPNHKMGQAGGGGMVINVDARGSSDPAAVRAQVQQGILEAAPAIVAAAEQRTMNNLRRPRLGGVIQ